MKELYRIDNTREQDNSVITTVILNPSHEVFSGHFPGKPILPGVIIIQILKEIAEKKSGKSLVMSRADSIKYLSFISPELNKTLVFETELVDSGQSIKFSCNVSSGTSVYCRLKGEFTSE